MTEKTRFELSSRDYDLIRTLQSMCHLNQKETFSSDDFRQLGLDRFLHGDKKHAIGGFFARLIKNKVIAEAGWKRSQLPSNKWRKIRVYTWTEKTVEVET